MTQLAGAAGERFLRQRVQSRQPLMEFGTICAQSGTLSRGALSVSLYSDFGPTEQDKVTNQDYGIAIICPAGAPLRWALAMADGVTSAYHAELAAELACWTSLKQLVADAPNETECARPAVEAAGLAIGELADLITANADEYRPDGEFPSTWRYTLREGLFLQTTLTLVWQLQDAVHLVMVGDAGAVICRDQGDDRRTAVLADADHATNRVHALGPLNRHVSQFDFTQSIHPGSSFRMAIYTDGIARGLHPNPRRVFEMLNGHAADDNPAQSVIQHWINSEADAFQDNLTLALVTETSPSEASD